MKKNAQKMYDSATRTKFQPLGITALGGPSVFDPQIHTELKPFLRVIFRLERDEARSRIKGRGKYEPSHAWKQKAGKLATGKTY